MYPAARPIRLHARTRLRDATSIDPEVVLTALLLRLQASGSLSSPSRTFLGIITGRDALRRSPAGKDRPMARPAMKEHSRQQHPGGAGRPDVATRPLRRVSRE